MSKVSSNLSISMPVFTSDSSSISDSKYRKKCKTHSSGLGMKLKRTKRLNSDCCSESAKLRAMRVILRFYRSHELDKNNSIYSRRIILND